MRKEIKGVIGVPVSLWNLIKRLEFRSHLLKEHPEAEDMLNRHMERTKQLIIECILQNKDNPLFKRILMR